MIKKTDKFLYVGDHDEWRYQVLEVKNFACDGDTRLRRVNDNKAEWFGFYHSLIKRGQIIPLIPALKIIHGID